MKISTDAAQKALNFAVSLGLVPAGNNEQNLQKMIEVLASANFAGEPMRTSLHGQIMNIQCTRPADIAAETAEMAYAYGHRDARHAAAELALTGN